MEAFHEVIPGSRGHYRRTRLAFLDQSKLFEFSLVFRVDCIEKNFGDSLSSSLK